MRLKQMHLDYYQKQDNYNTQRVHKVNLVLLTALVFLIVVPITVERGVSDSAGIIVAGALVLLLSAVNYFLPIPEYLKGLFFALLPNIVVVALFNLDGFALNKHYLILLTLAMVTLYLKKELILVFSLIVNAAYISMYMFNPSGLLGSEQGLCISSAPSYEIWKIHLFNWDKPKFC